MGTLRKSTMLVKVFPGVHIPRIVPPAYTEMDGQCAPRLVRSWRSGRNHWLYRAQYRVQSHLQALQAPHLDTCWLYDV